MNLNFGTGLSLRDACPWLRDEDARHELILDVTERNSVIEGLPPFDAEMRRKLKDQLKALAAPSSTHDEELRPKGRSSGQTPD
jgi:hypothetical protein